MKIGFIIIGIVIFIAYLLPVFEKILNFGNLAGMLLGIATFAVGMTIDKMSFELTKWSVFTVTIGIFIVVAVSNMIYREGKTRANNEKVVIVLGCKVKGDRPCLALEKRIDSAYDFLLCNKDSVAILSGGQGRGELISEAVCMKQILVQRGIDKKRLFLEEQSVNTDENIRFSLDIIEKYGLPKQVAVATSEYHQYRAGLICSRYGLEARALSSATRIDLLPTFLLRESMGIIKEKLFKR
ncbi:MAG: YdcF family protein [Acetobacter sp.]|nr:YdcF family protein [Bacteroides sp.]MCM1340396.1 YdcF family protein [Acetobacter sp.]MCM1432957.1 YdcF family protein [Clostridiales bacterium]